MDRVICYTKVLKILRGLYNGEVFIMSNDDYTTIKLPNEIVQRIKRLVDSNKYGFKSKSEFIKEAIRQELKYYENANHREKNGENE